MNAMARIMDIFGTEEVDPTSLDCDNCVHVEVCAFCYLLEKEREIAIKFINPGDMAKQCNKFQMWVES